VIRTRLVRRRGAFTLDVSLEVAAGVTALYGPSGSGKSTLLHTLLGFEPLDEGEIRWNDRLLERSPGGPRLAPERRGFAAVFQDALLFPHLTVEENVRFGVGLRVGSARTGRPESWLKLLRLEHLRRRLPATLSGGERQRVAIARALSAAPRALFLDEPLNSLDAVMKRETLLALRRLRRELDLPVIYVTHEMAEVMAIADRVVRLEGGRILWEDEPARILLEPGGLGRDEPANFLEARILRIEATGAADLEWGPHRLHTVIQRGSAGEAVTLCVRPADLLLAVGQTGKVSARNRLEMTVRSVLATPDRVWVSLEAVDPFFALVTPESARDLKLAPGSAVTVLFKSLAVSEDGPAR
jgi:molybdate transport system ATP-binding protein